MEFNLTTFQKLAIIVFLVIGVSNTYSLYYTWNFIDTGAKVGKIASIFFNFLLAYLFYWFLKQSKLQTTNLELKNDKEILKVLEDEK